MPHEVEQPKKQLSWKLAPNVLQNSEYMQQPSPGSELATKNLTVMINKKKGAIPRLKDYFNTLEVSKESQIFNPLYKKEKHIQSNFQIFSLLK